MYFLFLTSFLKSFNPYLRKHILNSLESHEYLFLNTFIISFFVFIYFLYKLIFHNYSLNNLLNRINNLTILHIICFIIIAFITVISSIVIINFDKYYNTPLINSLLSKGILTILLLLFGIFIYNEKYNYKQLFGIFLIVLGLFLINCKNNQFFLFTQLNI
jgi:drug/metabolite transporter (DMT)-like permease